MAITQDDFYSVYLHTSVIDQEVALWQKFFACNTKLPLINFITDDVDVKWAEKIVNYTADEGEKYASIITKIASEMARQEDAFSEIGYVEDLTYRESLLRAVNIIEAGDSELSYALRKFVGQIVIVESDSLVATSSVLFLGLVVIAPKPEWSLHDYIENLIHEMSHIELYIKQLTDPLVVKGAQLRSPFRSHPRPVNGVFHAAFVLARIVFYMNKIQLSVSDSGYSETKAANSNKLLGETVEQFEDNSLLTHHGIKVMNELKSINFQFQGEGFLNACV